MKVWTPTRLSNGEGRASRGLDRALFGAGAGMIARALDRPRCPQAPPTRGGVTLHDGLHCAARGALPWIGGTINQPPRPALTQASAHTTTQPSASSLPIMTLRPTSPCRKLSRSPDRVIAFDRTQLSRSPECAVCRSTSAVGFAVPNCAAPASTRPPASSTRWHASSQIFAVGRGSASCCGQIRASAATR